jgi:hypothetical protein
MLSNAWDEAVIPKGHLDPGTVSVGAGTLVFQTRHVLELVRQKRKTLKDF